MRMRGLRTWGELRASSWDSPRFREGAFHSSEPTHIFGGLEWVPMFSTWAAHQLRAEAPRDVPVVQPRFDDASDLAATWLGHAGVVLELDGRRVLIDPVFSDRASPFSFAGPRRSHESPLQVEGLPALTAVVISHDHYDHLDMATIDALLITQECPFVVPLGVGGHLRRWGVPKGRIIERDWGGQVRLGSLTLTCTEARHFSGRWLKRNRTLWSSWVLTADDGPRVFFGGDSGYTPAFAELGRAYGPFDLTMLPIGSYDRRWPDVHLDPEQAVQTHFDVGGGVMMPIHWLTWDLAFHHWREPIERVVAAAEARDVNIALPRPGERLVLDSVPTDAWWAAL